MHIKAEEGKWIIVAAINHTELNHNKFIVPEPGWSRVTRAGWDTGLRTRDVATRAVIQDSDTLIPISRVVSISEHDAMHQEYFRLAK